MAEEETELSEKQKNEIAKWFLLNAPAGEIQYVAKGYLSDVLASHLLFLLPFLFSRF